jgi:uncharacterized protein (DUF1810 family)
MYESCLQLSLPLSSFSSHIDRYIFPQIDLTAFYPHASSMSRMYSIADMPELHAYVECKTLRANYIEGLDVMLELFNLKFESDLDPDASSLEVVPLAIEDGKEGGEKGMKNIEHYRLNQIFSSIDCVKFRSSLTLFEQCGVREIAVRCTKLIDHLGRPRDQKTEAQMKKTRHLVVQE